jgi:hypothetical protein
MLDGCGLTWCGCRTETRVYTLLLDAFLETRVVNEAVITFPLLSSLFLLGLLLARLWPLLLLLVLVPLILLLPVLLPLILLLLVPLLLVLLLLVLAGAAWVVTRTGAYPFFLGAVVGCLVRASAVAVRDLITSAVDDPVYAPTMAIRDPITSAVDDPVYAPTMAIRDPITSAVDYLVCASTMAVWDSIVPTVDYLVCAPTVAAPFLVQLALSRLGLAASADQILVGIAYWRYR